MKIIILAAGQGNRLKPFTDHKPKCMVEVNGKSIIDRQLETLYSCGIQQSDIIIVAGYCSNVLTEHLDGTEIQVIKNPKFESTNMVCSLMCAKEVMEKENDIIISYGDIIYNETVFQTVLASEDEMSAAVDDGWYEYWAQRCENPFDDAETLMFDEEHFLKEIGQKTSDIKKIQSQYIGLLRFRDAGLKALLAAAAEAEQTSIKGQKLWRTDRNYSQMYMTDLLQGMIDEKNRIRALHINRGWFEVDNHTDLKIAEAGL